jgi:DNA-directed RNA polymerase specialized sigma24 family protein
MPDVADEDELEAEALARSDAQRTMARLRELLSQAELEVLLLFSVERLSEGEIAQVVRRSERAVHSILLRAREKAREALAADAYREQQ